MAEDPSQVLKMQQKYIEFFELPVDRKCVLLEALQGKNFGYSMQTLARTLCSKPEFSEYKVYAVCTPENQKERKDFFDFIGAPGIQPVLYATEEYNRLLATAGVLINENSFQNHFIKKEEQIYIRIWNGIPMKKSGRYADTDYAGIGNTQRNLLCADFLVCPNEFTKNILEDNYMLSNIGKTRVIYAGRFQNEILFDQPAVDNLRSKYGLDGKTVVLYLPSIRGSIGSEERKKAEAALWETVQQLDQKLTNQQLLYVLAPHSLRNEYDYASLQHVDFVPKSCGTVRAMALAKVLITDCSDTIFDFASTGRKIILFSYDHAEQYMEQFYSLHPELPFPNVDSVDALIAEINSEKKYDDEEFFLKYSKYNKPGMAEAVLRRVLLSEPVPELTVTTLSDNGKQNVILYPGPLLQNGITSSVLSLLEHLDKEKNNYVLFFRTEHVQQAAETLKALPAGVNYYGYTYVSGVSPADDEVYEAWQKESDYPYEKAKPVIYKRAGLEQKRLLSFLRIETVIHYEGYGRDILPLFERMPCQRIIYLHNNMLLEIEKKGIRPEPLCQAYHAYDVIALVSEEQRNVAEQMVSMDGGNPADKRIVLAKNVIPYERVVERSKEPLKLDENTELNVSETQMRKLLTSGKKKFVTIGRFLPEKGHDRMISAFEKVHEKYPDTCLILLGGYGPLYEETVRQAEQSPAGEDIVVIKYLSNPYALLKACDYFVLSSHYEGLPVVLTEADIVGLPCISTDIPGPRTMMGQYGGLLTKNSEQGVMDGMLACLTGRAPKRFTLDYSKYNREAVAQFEAMLPER